MGAPIEVEQEQIVEVLGPLEIVDRVVENFVAKKEQIANVPKVTLKEVYKTVSEIRKIQKFVEVPQIVYVDKVVDCPKIVTKEKVVEIVKMEHIDHEEEIIYEQVDLGTVEVETIREKGSGEQGG